MSGNGKLRQTFAFSGSRVFNGSGWFFDPVILIWREILANFPRRGPSSQIGATRPRVKWKLNFILVICV
jgi:hypothetical protein